MNALPAPPRASRPHPFISATAGTRSGPPAAPASGRSPARRAPKTGPRGRLRGATVRSLLLAGELHAAAVPFAELAALPAAPGPLDVVVIDERDRPVVHV